MKTGQSRGEDWEYLAISSHCRPKFLPQGDGTFELVLIVCGLYLLFSPLLKCFRITTFTVPS